MKSSELRIGNLVLSVEIDNFNQEWRFKAEVVKLENESFECIVYTHHGKGIVNNKQEYGHRFKGIPLTEEWLIKLGFSEYKSYYWVCSIYRVNAMSDGTWYFGYKDEQFNMAELFYVHQLQNLYQALTGSELEVII